MVQRWCRLHLPWRGLLLCSAGACVLAEPAEPTCAAGKPCSAGGVDESGYFWPRARGHVGSYSRTNHTAPKDFARHLAWKWQHPNGKFNTVIVGGPVIDDKKNLYITTETGAYKFSPDGVQLWYWRPATGFIHTSPSIMDGALYGNVDNGYMFALDMETGRERWLKKFGEKTGGDTAYVESYRGVVINALNPPMEGGSMGGGGNTKIVVVNATTGKRLWDFTESKNLWNFMAMFVGDDTFVYMDVHGGVYRRNLFNGTRLWYVPPPPLDQGSWTDGFVNLGPGGEDALAYACSDHGTGQAGETGVLRAYTVRDGTFVWARELPQPCTTWAVSDGETVVIGTAPLPSFPGAFKLGAWQNIPLAVTSFMHHVSIWLGPKSRYLWGNPILYSEMQAFDAKTGTEKWRYSGTPPYERPACAGDEEGFETRMQLGIRSLCLTAGWASHTMSGDGTIYTPHMDGHIYAIGDANRDGVIDGATEVSKYFGGSASLHMGTAWAPGMMAQASCDTLSVFKF